VKPPVGVEGELPHRHPNIAALGRRRRHLVLHPMMLYPLGVMGLAIALAGAVFPARRAARSRAVTILRSE